MDFFPRCFWCVAIQFMPTRNWLFIYCLPGCREGVEEESLVFLSQVWKYRTISSTMPVHFSDQKCRFVKGASCKTLAVTNQFAPKGQQHVWIAFQHGQANLAPKCILHIARSCQMLWTSVNGMVSPPSVLATAWMLLWTNFSPIFWSKFQKWMIQLNYKVTKREADLHKIAHCWSFTYYWPSSPAHSET